MILRRFTLAILVLGALAPASGVRAQAQSSTSRLALVIGEAQYRDGPLPTAANDGGLMADMLRQAGYDVTGAANLSQDQIRSAFREFLEKTAAVGPRAEIFVYLSGKGLQFSGENYFAPVEASIANAATTPAEAVRLADFLGPLENLPARARVVVLDLARPNNFGRTGQPLASGLAIVDAPENTLVAFGAAPGTIAPDGTGSYGAYAQSLVEMLRQPGLPLDDAFAQVRLRVNEATRGGQTPWNVTKLSAGYALFAPVPGSAAPPPVRVVRVNRPMRELSPPEAYGIAVEQDTFESYNQFLIAFPNDPLAGRVRAMMAARREAITWRRTFVANTPEAYWTYLQRYPRGPHAPDAARRLSFLSAPFAPPPRFRVYDEYDVPPPPPEEIVIVDRPRFYVNEIVDVPPPRYADDFLPPIPPAYRDLPPPPPPPRFGFLPIPIPIPIPFGRPQGPPGMVTAPRFVQQPIQAQPGAPPPQVPQGYSPMPPGGVGSRPAGPAIGAPSTSPPPGTALPAPGNRLPGAPVTTPPPGTALPGPAGRPPGAPLTTVPPGTALPGPAGRPPGAPATTVPQTLPPVAPVQPGPRVPPVAPPTAVPHAPSSAPSPNTLPPADALPPVAPVPKPSPAPAPALGTPPRVEPGVTAPRPATVPHVEPVRPSAPPTSAPPPMPRAEPSVPRAEPPRSAPPPMPRAEPPRSAPPAMPHAEPPRPAPPPMPHAEPARPSPPPMSAPRPAEHPAASRPPGGPPHGPGGEPHEERRPGG